MNLCSGVPLAVSKEGARKGRMGGRSKGGSERQHTKEAEACKTNERTGAREKHITMNFCTMRPKGSTPTLNIALSMRDAPY